MIIRAVPQWVSYKDRAVKINGEWIKVAKDLELNNIRVYKMNELVISDDINGRQIISAVRNVTDIK